MKLTNQELMQIIKEELGYALQEQPLDEAPQENPGLRILRMKITRLLHDNRELFRDPQDMKDFVNHAADKFSQMMQNQNFGQDAKRPTMGTVVVDNPMMEQKKTK